MRVAWALELTRCAALVLGVVLTTGPFCLGPLCLAWPFAGGAAAGRCARVTCFVDAGAGTSGEAGVALLPAAIWCLARFGCRTGTRRAALGAAAPTTVPVSNRVVRNC